MHELSSLEVEREKELRIIQAVMYEELVLRNSEGGIIDTPSVRDVLTHWRTLIPTLGIPAGGLWWFAFERDDMQMVALLTQPTIDLIMEDVLKASSIDMQDMLQSEANNIQLLSTYLIPEHS